MTDPYEHLRTPSAYDDMIRPLLAAKEAVEANMKAVEFTTEYGWLFSARQSLSNVIADIENAHRWDGDERRT